MTVRCKCTSDGRYKLPILWAVFDKRERTYLPLIHQNEQPCKAAITKQLKDYGGKPTGRKREEYEVRKLSVTYDDPLNKEDIKTLLESIGVDSDKLDELTLQVIRNAQK